MNTQINVIITVFRETHALNLCFYLHYEMTVARCTMNVLTNSVRTVLDVKMFLLLFYHVNSDLRNLEKKCFSDYK